jgi:hypothetical protein
MMQVNRQIKGNAGLDCVDHALGRPFYAFGGYRNHYATCCPDQKESMRICRWWEEGATRGDMTFFHVTNEGRAALARELADHETYGRLYEVRRVNEWGGEHVMATSASAAKYAAYLKADLDWTFMEFCHGLRVRLADGGQRGRT